LTVGYPAQARFGRFANLALPCLVVALLVLIPDRSWGSPGWLDTSFDTDGTVTTPFGAAGDEDVAFGVAVQTDGKIVAAGISGDEDFAVARYNPDGSLDTSFDGDGRVTTEVSGVDEARGVAIQTDGKIVVAGFANALSGSGGLGGDFAMVRYNTDGSLDTSFDGDGKVITEVGSFSGPAFAVALQSDGKIVVAGRASTGTHDDFALVRYNTNGSQDTTFDGDGELMTDVGGIAEDDEARAVSIQPDGKIVAVGLSDTLAQGTNDDFAAARYNANGTLDTTFSSDGKVTTPISTDPTFDQDQAHAVVVQGDDKIVAAGEADEPIQSFALVRYNADGTLDTGFDGDGKVVTNMSPIDNTSVAFGVGIQDGKLVAGGRAANFDDDTGFFHNEFAVARYNDDGSLDTSFDGDGKIITAIAPPGQSDIIRALAVQPDDKIVVAGTSDMGPPEFLDFDFSLARYLPHAIHTLTVAKDGSGSGSVRSSPAGIQCGNDCSEPFTDDTEIILTARAGPYSKFMGWSGGGCVGTRRCTLTLGADTLVTATFSIVCADRVATHWGTSGPDTLTGTEDADVMAGLDDGDTLSGLGSSDFLCGGAGNDTLQGDDGNDKMLGENGNDDLQGGDGNDVLRAGAGDDVMDGGPGQDTCAGGPGVDTAVNCEVTKGIP
jgi:uncharacterized delta-60 repeat protein